MRARTNSHGLPVIKFAKDYKPPKGALTRQQLGLTTLKVVDFTDCQCGMCGNFEFTERLKDPRAQIAFYAWKAVRSAISDIFESKFN